ncbi:MAG: hypothetical protein RLZZ341_1574, partial [Pseudomonadota bacterium]
MDDPRTPRPTVPRRRLLGAGAALAGLAALPARAQAPAWP